MRKLLLLFLLAIPSIGQAATVAEIKTAIENWRTTHGPKLVDRQEAYAATHGGHYWQGIITPSLHPDDGKTRLADWTRKPTDQITRWIDLFNGSFALPDNLFAQIQVDTYDGPFGKGWTMTLQATKTGTLYWRTWNVGPETYRNIGWRSSSLQ